MFGRVKKAGKWWCKTWISAGREGLALREQRIAIGIAKESVQKIKNSGRRLRDNRDPSAPGAPNMADFKQVLAHWGIREEERLKTVRGFALEISVWVLLIAVAISGLSARPGLLAGFGDVCVLGGGLAIITFRVWRADVLLHRQFVPFRRWILGPFCREADNDNP